MKTKYRFHLACTQKQLLSAVCVCLSIACVGGYLVGRYCDQAILGEFKSLKTRLSYVRAYEQELKLRAHALQSTLKEARDLEHFDTGGRTDSTKAGLSGKRFSANSAVSGQVREQGGVGGGEPRKAAVISLSGKLENKADSLSLIDFVDQQIDRVRSYPLGSPVVGNVTSDFGKRRSPFTGRPDFHSGVDISIDRSTPVKAVADGVVIMSGYKGAYGKVVVVDHGNGFETVYGHLSQISAKPGEKVCRGEIVGNVGSTGRSTGPHLHFEVRKNGEPQNPIPYMELAQTLKAFG